MTSDGILRRQAYLLDASVGDDLLVLDPTCGRLHVLSHSASLIYAAADGMSTTGDIATSLSVDLGLDANQISPDVVTAVATMVDQGLLASDDPSSDTAGLPRLAVLHVPPPDVRAAPGPTGGLIDLGPRQAGTGVVRVATDMPDVHALLREPLGLLPPAPSSTPNEVVVTVTEPHSGGWLEIRDGLRFTTAPSAEAAAEAVLAACNRIALTTPTDAVRIHGGVSSNSDRAVIVCGDRGAGKSSLTAALVQSGWRYLTDKIAVVDSETRQVTPYPKWIDLSTDSLRLLGVDDSVAIGPTGRRHHVPPQVLGEVGEAATVEAIVILDGSDDPTAEIRELSLRDAVPAMLANVFATTWEHAHGLQAVVDLCAATTVVQMPRRPLSEMVALVRALVE